MLTGAADLGAAGATGTTMASLRRSVDEQRRFEAWLRCWVWLAGMVASGATVAGCGSGSAVTTTGPSGPKCQVQLAPSSSSVGPDGGPGTVTVTASPECPWNVSAGVNWLSGLSPTAGQGSGTVNFQVAPNPMPSARDGDIVVNDAHLRVSQQAAPCQFQFQPGSLTVAAGGGTSQVAVATATGCSWTLATDANWIVFTTPVTGSGNGTVGLSIAPNPGTESRTASVVVGNQRITVTQAGVASTACSYALSVTADVSIAAAGASGTVAVSTTPACAWTASSSVPWVTVTSGGAGTGSGTVAFTVAMNSGGTRAGTVTIAGHTVTVTQAGAAVSCTYSIGPPDASIAASGGTGSAAVSASAGCAWTASSSVPWVTVTSGATGTGNGAVAFSVAPNSGSARTGTVTIAGQTFTVNQAAAPVSCSYTIAPTHASIASAGGTGTIVVTTTASCNWTASSGTGWITLTSGGSGTGNGSVAFSVAANPGGARSGILTIGGLTFTVNQAAAISCSYALSANGVTISEDGGNATVNVSAASGCAWTARSNDDFITLTSGANGSGNGTVAFNVKKHNGKGDRTGTLTVAGHTFTVRQRGKDD